MNDETLREDIIDTLLHFAVEDIVKAAGDDMISSWLLGRAAGSYSAARLVAGTQWPEFETWREWVLEAHESVGVPA